VYVRVVGVHVVLCNLKKIGLEINLVYAGLRPVRLADKP
jgi:hypothetical protein